MYSITWWYQSLARSDGRSDVDHQELFGLRRCPRRVYAMVVRSQRGSVFLDHALPGLMYYFLPKAADRPVFSYKLSIIHFWSLVFIYIWAGPHHLHYTALPEWASSLGMLFSVCFGCRAGGDDQWSADLAWSMERVSTDPVLKFFVVGITFYGMRARSKVRC